MSVDGDPAERMVFEEKRELVLKVEDHYTIRDHFSITSSGVPLRMVAILLNETEELDWNEMLIKRYIGREGLWLHRRVLSLCWMKQFATDIIDLSCNYEQEISISNGCGFFIDNQLRLLHSCSTVPDNDFEDCQAQATFSGTYILWLTKQSPEFWFEHQEKLTAGNLKTVLSKVCPEGPSFGIL